MSALRISAVTVTPVAFSDPPLLNSVGVHEPFALRAVVEVSTDGGLSGRGETYADERHPAALRAAADAIVGADAYHTEQIYRRVQALAAPDTPIASGLIGDSSATDRAFAHLPPAIRAGAVQVVLSDHHYWGGLRRSRLLAGICETFGLGLSMHSNSHLGISLAATPTLACPGTQPAPQPSRVAHIPRSKLSATWIGVVREWLGVAVGRVPRSVREVRTVSGPGRRCRRGRRRR